MVDFFVHDATTVSFGTESGFDFKGQSTEVEMDITTKPNDLVWKEPPIELVVNTKTNFTAVVDVRPPERVISEGPDISDKIKQIKDIVLETEKGAYKYYRWAKDVAGTLGKLPLSAIYGGGGAGLATVAKATSGVGAAAVGGYIIGTGIDKIITVLAGESLGEIVYDKWHPGE